MSDQPMGRGWWLASDGKWYAPELHPNSLGEAPTRETPVAGQGPPPTPGPPATPGPPGGYGSTSAYDPPGAWDPPGAHDSTSAAGPPTLAIPVTPGGPVDGPKRKGGGPMAALLVGLVFLAALVVGGCVALVLSARQSSTDTTAAPASTDRDLAPSTTLEIERQPTTTADFSPGPESPSTTTEQSPPETTPTTSLVPAPPGTQPERSTMPEVVCMDLQQAQDTIQAAGVFFSRSFDATGKGRSQIIDRNWIVVSQDPPAGSPISNGEPNLGAVKKNEPNPC